MPREFPRRKYLTAVRPGPTGSGGGPLPPSPPAGELPPEDSKLWVFTAKSIQGGENFIQDDTVEWFNERSGKIQICREYPDHPRWLIEGVNSVRAKMFNSHIISEIHMLARQRKGLPEYPSWVPARMSVKQAQANIAFRLTKHTGEVFRIKGREALETFAERSPGQFIKFVGATFIPKKIEAELTPVDPNGGLTREQTDSLLGAIAEELDRRKDEANTITVMPLDYEAPREIVDTLADAAELMRTSAAIPDDVKLYKTITTPGDRHEATRLKFVKDAEADILPDKLIEPQEDWG